MVITGGFVSALLMNSVDQIVENDKTSSTRLYNSIDFIFIKNLIPIIDEDLKLRITAFVRLIQPHFKLIDYDCVTVHAWHHISSSQYILRPCIFRIISKVISNISTLLDQADMGSSAIVWTGENVYASCAGRFTVERGLNCFNSNNLSPIYANRVRKYFNRGFGIITTCLVKPGTHFFTVSYRKGSSRRS